MAINSTREFLKSYLMNHGVDTDSILKILLEIINKLDQNNRTEFYDFLGELLRYKWDIFMRDLYYPLLPKIKKQFTDEQFMEMEEHILNKFCIGSEEKILLKFHGILIFHGDKVLGRIFLTNSRIIGLGKVVYKQSSTSLTHGLVGVIASSAIRAHQRHIREAAIDASVKEEDEVLFGFPVTIDGIFQYKKTESYFLYRINVPKPHKIESFIKMSVKIIPKPTKKESAKKPKVKKVEILNNIESILQSLQKLEGSTKI